MDGEIVDKIEDKKTLQEIEKTELSVGENPNTVLAVRQTLEKKGYNLDKLLDMAVEIAESAYSAPRGEGGADYGKRLKAIELMLEAAGYVKRKNGVEVKFSLNKLLYGN